MGALFRIVGVWQTPWRIISGAAILALGLVSYNIWSSKGWEWHVECATAYTFGIPEKTPKGQGLLYQLQLAQRLLEKEGVKKDITELLELSKTKRDFWISEAENKDELTEKVKFHYLHCPEGV